MTLPKNNTHEMVEQVKTINTYKSDNVPYSISMTKHEDKIKLTATKPCLNNSFYNTLQNKLNLGTTSKLTTTRGRYGWQSKTYRDKCNQTR